LDVQLGKSNRKETTMKEMTAEEMREAEELNRSISKRCDMWKVLDKAKGRNAGMTGELLDEMREAVEVRHLSWDDIRDALRDAQCPTVKDASAKPDGWVTMSNAFGACKDETGSMPDEALLGELETAFNRGVSWDTTIKTVCSVFDGNESATEMNDHITNEL